mmetsp:Transcript_1917/g.5073  ORF Transcript_1917/g.5073 Transcript_1917/m.5073 type:complete len:124 (-) Transcript_1917:346-717(-)
MIYYMQTENYIDDVELRFFGALCSKRFGTAYSYHNWQLYNSRLTSLGTELIATLPFSLNMISRVHCYRVERLATAPSNAHQMLSFSRRQLRSHAMASSETGTAVRLMALANLIQKLSTLSSSA